MTDNEVIWLRLESYLKSIIFELKLLNQKTQALTKLVEEDLENCGTAEEIHGRD